MLTQPPNAIEEKDMDRVTKILDAWSNVGAERLSVNTISVEAAESSEKVEVASPNPTSDSESDSKEKHQFALGYHEELWWLLRRYINLLTVVFLG